MKDATSSGRPHSAPRKDGPVRNGKKCDLRSLKCGFLVVGAGIALLSILTTAFLAHRLVDISRFSLTDVAGALRGQIVISWVAMSARLLVVEGLLFLLYRYIRDRNMRIATLDEQLSAHAHDVVSMLSGGKISLRAALEQLRDAIRTLPVIVFMTDRNGVFTLSEGGGLEAIGLEPGAVVGKSLFTVYGGFPEIIRLNHEALSGRTFTSPIKVQGRRYMCHYAPLRDDRGAVNGVIGAALDVTDFESARDALMLSKRGFEQLVRLSPVGILVFVDGKITFANNAAAAILGVPDEESLVGRQAMDFALKEDKERLTEQIALLRKGSDVPRMEGRIRRSDGEIRKISIAATPFKERKKPAALVVIEDVTEDKEAENTRLRLAAIVESAHEAIIGWGPDGTITSWNPAAERLYGYSEGEALGMSIVELAPDEKRSAEISDIIDRIRRGQHVGPQVTARRKKDGGIIAVRLTVSPVRDVAGKVIGASTFAVRADEGDAP